jgi:hypothetical protein
MPLQGDGNAPYAPASAVIDVIRRYRDRGLQTPFTTDVLTRAGVSESLAPRTLQAFKLLELVGEEGEPTEALVSLAKAPTDEEYRDRLASLIRGVYAKVFSFVDPAEEDQERVRGAFRSFEPRGQQERMVRLFLALCAHAGIIPEAAARVTSEATPRRDSARREPRARATHTTRRSRTPDPRPEVEGLPPVLGGLIRELISIGQTWNAEQRDRFLSAFRSMVDYTYPVQSMTHAPDDGEEPED